MTASHGRQWQAAFELIEHCALLLAARHFCAGTSQCRQQALLYKQCNASQSLMRSTDCLAMQCCHTAIKFQLSHQQHWLILKNMLHRAM
jgi:hypothetical protein